MYMAMATNGHFHNLTMSHSQFPQPTRPFGALDTCTDSRLSRFPEKYDYNMQPYSYRTSEGEGIAEVDNDLFQILREFAVEFDGEGGEILHKFFSKLENNVPQDHGMIKEILEDFRGKVPDLFEKLCTRLNPNGVVNHPVTMQRGVNCDPNSAGEEQELKLEWFKVRTVKQGGVVKVLKN